MRTTLLFVLMCTLGAFALQRAESDISENACSKAPLGVDEYIYTPIKIGDRTMQGLVDTGATGTFMALCVVEGLPHEVAKKSEATTKVAMGNGDISDVAIWTVTFDIGPYRISNQTVYVTDRLTTPIVLGMDVLAGTNAIVTPGVRKIIFLPPDQALRNE